MTAVWRRAAAAVSPPQAATVDARWFWLACALLAAALLLPISLHPYPGMPDWPNHLARAQLIVDEQLHGQVHPHFVLRHALIPNLALDGLVPLLVHAGLSAHDALRVFTGLALLLPVAGVIAVARVVHGTTPWLALLAFPLAFSRYFAWGFVNYFFSIGLALLVFALWLHWHERHPWRAALALGIGGTAILLSHLMGLGVLGLLVLAREAYRFRQAPPSPARRRAPLPALAALAALAAGYLLFFDRGLKLDVEWFDSLGSRLRNLVSPFLAYDLAPGLLVMALVTGLLAWLALTRRLTLAPGGGFAVLPLVLAFALLPSVIMNSHYANSRLFAVAVLVAIAYLGMRADRRSVAALLVVAGVATVLRTAEVDRHWAASSPRTAELREALHALPPGARVASIVSVNRASAVALYPHRHVAAYAVVDRQAYIPNFFGYPFNGESIAFRPDGARIAGLANKDEVVFWEGDKVPWPVYCAHYDAVLVMHDSGPPVAPPCPSRPLGSGPGFTLHAIERR